MASWRPEHARYLNVLKLRVTPVEIPRLAPLPRNDRRGGREMMKKGTVAGFRRSERDGKSQELGDSAIRECQMHEFPAEGDTLICRRQETVGRGPVDGPGSSRGQGDVMSCGAVGAADRGISLAVV